MKPSASASDTTSSSQRSAPLTAAVAPSLSAADALASTPFFGALSAVDLARLVPDLEEYFLEPGQIVYQQGDSGDGFYVIRSGSIEAVVTEAGGTQRVTQLAAPAHFGEGALLTDAPRSSTVTAITPLVLWKLPRERFATLLRDHPEMALQIAAELSERLATVNRELSASRQQIATVARAAYSVLDAPAQALLRRTAVFRRFDPDLLRATLGSDWSAVPFEQLVADEVFFRPSTDVGWYAFAQESMREFLLHQLWLELGDRRLKALRLHAAEALLARADITDVDVLNAMDLLSEAEHWSRLGQVLEERGAALADHDQGKVEALLRALPPKALWHRPVLVRLLAECCVAQGNHERAIETYHEAGRQRGVTRHPLVVIEHQHALATLYEHIDDHPSALVCRQLAMELEQQHGSGASSDQDDTMPARSRRSSVASTVSNGVVGLSRLRERAIPTRPLFVLGVLALGVAAWFLPLPVGLTASGLQVLITLITLILLDALDVLPTPILALVLIASWVVLGIVPTEVAASGFANSTWFLLLASMVIGAAVARSGLLYRGAVELVRRLPASHTIRCLALGGLGVVLSPGMPDPAGRVMLVMPLAQDIADTLRYPDRSPGSAGLALSTFIGFGMMGALFLTGTPGALIAYGLLPAETRAQTNWVTWFLAALPACAILFLLTMAFVLVRYRPEQSSDRPDATLALQGRVLGAMTRDEWSVLTILGVLLVGFSTQELHGVGPPWLAIAAVAALFLLGTLDEASLRTGVNLGFLLYVGVILSFGGVFAYVGLDAWLVERLSGLSGVIGGSPIVCLLIVAGLAALVGIALRPNPIVLLMAVALVPAAAAAGVDPWLVLFTAMLANNLWLYPQQSVLYQAAYIATGERAFSHEQVRPLAIAYAAFVVVALLASIPYWRWLGLIG